jgi:hypothetical protein
MNGRASVEQGGFVTAAQIMEPKIRETELGCLAAERITGSGYIVPTHPGRASVDS